MRAVVDWGLCEGNGACAEAAPQLFKMNDDDTLIVLNENPPETLREALTAAAMACPKRAITIEND